MAQEEEDNIHQAKAIAMHIYKQSKQLYTLPVPRAHVFASVCRRRQLKHAFAIVVSAHLWRADPHLIHHALFAMST